MFTVVGEVLPFAVAIAVSPLPIIVIVLVLVSDSARATGFGYVTGRIVALTGLVGVVMLVSNANTTETPHKHNPTTTSSIIRLIIGVLLVGYAAWLWHKRPRAGDEPKQSALMRRIDKVTPRTSFLLGVALIVFDATSLSLGIITGVDIGQAKLESAESVMVLAMFVIVATASALGPMIIYVLGGAAAQRTLHSVKGWLTAHEKAVMMVLFLVMGAVLIGRAIKYLAS